MANNVFANDLEVACKAGAGITAVAFPDPCWSPPPPSPGPIVIPYPNTAKASDTANGSKTVFISGKPVVLKNKSYFKTSTGNEPATEAFRKGTKTGKIKGKCYFSSWSMDVKIEGYNVCRHSDDTTHNHASHPGNTGRWGFVDSRSTRRACRKEIEREGKACGGMESRRRRSWTGRMKTEWSDVRSSSVDWKLRNCVGLTISPVGLDGQGLDSIEALQEKLGGSISEIGNIDQAVETIANEVIDNLQGTIQDLIAKGIIKKGIGVAAGTTGIGLIITAISAADAVNDALEMRDLLGQLSEMQNEAERIKTVMSDMQGKLESIPEQLRSGNTGAANDTLAELQRTIATANPCLRAKKCQLQSYDEGKKNLTSGRNQHRGCCKGQTPHHLIPDSYVKNASNPCPGYTHDDAPTVCAEGTTHRSSNGSHGALHSQLDTAIAEIRLPPSNAISYDDARDAAITSHRKTFPFSQCSKKCLRAQMDAYYDRKCNQDLQYTPMPGGLDASGGSGGF